MENGHSRALDLMKPQGGLLEACKNNQKRTIQTLLKKRIVSLSLKRGGSFSEEETLLLEALPPSAVLGVGRNTGSWDPVAPRPARTALPPCRRSAGPPQWPRRGPAARRRTSPHRWPSPRWWGGGHQRDFDHLPPGGDGGLCGPASSKVSSLSSAAAVGSIRVAASPRASAPAVKRFINWNPF